MGSLKPEGMDIGSMQDEGGYFALVANQAEFACLLDRADRVARTIGQSDHLR